MTNKINTHVSITVEIKESKRLPGMNEGYATLYDHNTGRILRTVRGRYILQGTTEEEFLDMEKVELSKIANRSIILAKVFDASGEITQAIIEEWLEEDSQFNDAKYHGDDRK